ncbi:MAG: hypothetical protein ACHQFZ_06600 [Acidimicrobiales bacterium]
MSELEREFGGLLETSESRWATIMVEGRTWVDADVQSRAWQAMIDRENKHGVSRAVFLRSHFARGGATRSQPAVEPAEHEETWCLWVTPDVRRAKFEVGGEIIDVVIEGSTFWSNGHGRSITNGGKQNVGHGQGDGENLIRTPDYCRLLHVEGVSEGTRLGRHTIEAKTSIGDDTDPFRGRGLHGLTTGAPELLELSVDRERGVVLSASSWFSGMIYRVVEMTEVEFDPEFAPEVFRITPKFSSQWTTV